MKKFLLLFIAACIAGFACFSVTYWVFKRGFDHSLQLSIILAVVWLIIQYAREYFEKRRKNKTIEK